VRDGEPEVVRLPEIDFIDDEGPHFGQLARGLD
jgi:hypothetical protein